YRIDRLNSKTGACEFVNASGLKAFTFMGYCLLVQSEMLQASLRGPSVTKELNDIDYLIYSMREGLHRGRPQVFLGYIYSPGHTPLVFDKTDVEASEKYREFYRKASKEAAAYLNEIVTFIANEDPEAIVYVFGDHGPMVSRSDVFEEDGATIVQDRFGVYGGVYPPDRCSDFFDEPYNNQFMTVIQGAHMIIKCLSDGKSAFVKMDDYRLPNSIPKEYNRYENYLYE
ncbi:MAG: hypothetical protein P8163_16715, partial [Candidatus Thiodiazotropha sp.]